MTNKQRFETLMRGGAPDRVPLLIFSELMPEDIYRDLIRPHGGGLIVHASSVHARYRRVEEITEHGEGTRTQRLITPKGELRAAYHTGHAAISGSGEVQCEWYVKDKDDYPAMIEALEDAEFYLDDTDYQRAVRYLGDEGVTHTWCDEPPYMGLQYLLGYENWALHQFDYPDLFDALMDAYARMQRRRMRLQARAPEKTLICLGNLAGNYAPEAFARRALPYFEEYGALLRDAGCSVTVHADALNLAAHSDIPLGGCVDVIEAFTPPPVGDLSLAAARKAWGQDVVFHINIPETIFYAGEDECYHWARALIQSDPNPRKFLSFTEMGFMGATGERREVFSRGMLGVMRALEEG